MKTINQYKIDIRYGYLVWDHESIVVEAEDEEEAEILADKKFTDEIDYEDYYITDCSFLKVKEIYPPKCDKTIDMFENKNG